MTIWGRPLLYQAQRLRWLLDQEALYSVGATFAFYLIRPNIKSVGDFWVQFQLLESLLDMRPGDVFGGRKIFEYGGTHEQQALFRIEIGVRTQFLLIFEKSVF
jgi:hypothetical protein